MTPCPPGGVIEGEPPCEDGYVDVFNGGCTSATPAFTPIAFGDTVCGESGVFLDSFNPTPDFDWYELTVTQTTEIVWTATATFRRSRRSHLRSTHRRREAS